MKVAAIVYEFPSVSETFVLGQITGLRTLGCEVTVFADGVDPAARASGAPTADARGVRYFGLPFKALREQYGRIRKPRGITSRTEAHGIATFLRDAAVNMRLAVEARAFTGTSAFDVIHAHFGPNGVRAVRLRKRGALRGPIITSFYGYDVGRRAAQSGYRELFDAGDCFLALSEHMREKLIELGCPPERLFVHRLGVDPAQFNRPGSNESAIFEILSVARLVPKKGIEHALQAAAILESHKVDFTYTIVGEGPLRTKLESLASTLGLSARVRFAGAKSHGTVAELLGRSDVLLAPSVTAPDGDVEGTPVAILEAAACGLPVVATRHAGIPEIVADGVSGFLVPEGDASSIAAKLMELAADPSRRDTMGREGRAMITAAHDLRVLNHDLLRTLERVRDEYESSLRK